MTNDVFVERMVKKRMDSKDAAIFAGAALLGIVIIALGMLVLFPLTGVIAIPLFILIGVCFGLFKLFAMRNLEFEYSFTNGFMAVDKIMNRSSRKRLTSFECKEVEEIGEYPKNQTRLQSREVQSKIFASEFSDGRESWYLLVNTKKTGKTLLVFDPDERLLEAIKKAIPSHLRFEVFGRK